MEEKIGKAGSIISTLEHQNEDLKRTLTDMEGQTERAENQAREIPRLRSMVSQLENVISSKDSELRRLEDDIRKKDFEINDQLRAV